MGTVIVELLLELGHLLDQVRQVLDLGRISCSSDVVFHEILQLSGHLPESDHVASLS